MSCEHKNRKHSAVKKTLTCQDCGAVFSEKGQLIEGGHRSIADEIGTIGFCGKHRYMQAVGKTKVRDFNIPVYCDTCNGQKLMKYGEEYVP
jgi:hypothetical protein